MSDLNQVNIIGRLTRDPIARKTNSGHSICDFGMAASRKYKGQDGNMKEEVLFIECSAWSALGENVAKYLKKGSRAYVGGRLKLDQWEKNGEKKSKISLVVESVIFLDQKNGEKAQAAPPTSSAPPDEWAGPDVETFEEPPF